MVFNEISYWQFEHFNANEFRTKMQEPLLKRCSFSNVITKETYLCLKSEICCENGCCVTSVRKMAQFWYLWVILIFVLIACMACMHYYKRTQDDRNEINCDRERRRQRLLAERLLRSHSGLYRRPEDYGILGPDFCSVHAELQRARRAAEDPPIVPPFEGAENGEIRDLFLEHLLATYRTNCDESATNIVSSLPPDYNSLEKDPMYTEPPPVYAVACKLLENSSVNLQTNVEEDSGSNEEEPAT